MKTKKMDQKRRIYQRLEECDCQAQNRDPCARVSSPSVRSVQISCHVAPAGVPLKAHEKKLGNINEKVKNMKNESDFESPRWLTFSFSQPPYQPQAGLTSMLEHDDLVSLLVGSDFV